MSRILHKIEEKLHIHHKHGDDDIPAARKTSHKKSLHLVKKVGKIAKKLLQGHNKTSREEGYEGEEEEEAAEEGEEVEAEEGGFEFEVDFDF
ncbi:hypothetical protein KY290_014075 [Solanum tuberosum]|uniref:Uncharacterized protein n=1 Tax=Solanum tuberosum TaxID=4113 RepID=A0ABQ7VNM0_SOLTU|nr:hypothetical protein KY289_014173 [Solanum tuberosum]KAH0717470.1 hypothetical protein KY285_013501 [Solanum tuberosum]KAH0770094.1 hypothetical protein KY290_014075 [Solanum tuberosum]